MRGGDKWASSFLGSFRYVDQMGRLATQGVAAVFHNTLAASDYALIDEAAMTPRPNYWTALLRRRLMGEVVLDAWPAKPGLPPLDICRLELKPNGELSRLALAAKPGDTRGVSTRWSVRIVVGSRSALG